MSSIAGFRTRELMSSCPLAESESRVARNLSTFSGAKKKYGVQEQLGMTGSGGCKEQGVGTQDLEAKAGLRHSAFSWFWGRL